MCRVWVTTMFKEKQIIAEYPFNKIDLIVARKSDKYQVGVDWMYVAESKSRPATVYWTMKGVIALLSSKGLQPGKEFVSEGSAPVTPPPAVVAPKQIVKCLGVVKRKYPNKRLVDCEVRGQKVKVKVRDNTHMRLNLILDVEESADGYISRNRVDERGRIYA